MMPNAARAGLDARHHLRAALLECIKHVTVTGRLRKACIVLMVLPASALKSSRIFRAFPDALQTLPA
jgi:hypothetical protein